MSEWISVNNRLPHPAEVVMVRHPSYPKDTSYSAYIHQDKDGSVYAIGTGAVRIFENEDDEEGYIQKWPVSEWSHVSRELRREINE